eukprot:scaffold651095_cov45-Prasinocladus_malaysianus.AAC.1
MGRLGCSEGYSYVPGSVQRCCCAPRSLVALLVLGSAAVLLHTADATITFSTSSGQTTYTERDPATAVDPSLTVSSDASEQLSSAIITIATPDNPTEDVLEFPQLGGGLASVDYDPDTKTIQLSGVATTDVYQNILRQMTFYNPSSTPDITDRQMVFQFFDASGTKVASSSFTKTLRIITVDDEPALTLSSSAVEYIEGSGKVSVDSTIAITDPDTLELNGISVQISSGYENGKDQLYLDIDVTDLDSDLEASWDATTATYSVYGLANKTVYQTVLRAFTFANEDQALTPGNRTITFSVSDQTSTTTADIIFMVKSVNQVPSIALSRSVLNFSERETDGLEIDTELTVTDVDTALLANCTISISSGYVAGVDI